MPEPAVLEEVEVTEAPASSRPDATAGLPDGASALDLMREALGETAPTESEPEPETTAEAAPPDGEAPKEDAPKAQPASRRAKTVEKVKTDAEQRIADAEARAAEAVKRAEEAEAKLSEAATSEDAAKNQERLQQLQAEYSEWIGTPEQYADAERLSLLDPEAEGWDWEQHRAAVNNLNTWKERRRWAGILTPNAESVGEARAFERISKDFVDTLSADLPESARETYRKHPDGIPGAVRFYAETVYAPKIEELEATIAERDAEIERLRAGGSGGYRSPASGGPAAPSVGGLDYSRMTPEELMQAELREQARQAGRRR